MRGSQSFARGMGLVGLVTLAMMSVHCGDRGPGDANADAMDAVDADAVLDVQPEAAGPSVVHFDPPATGAIDYGAVPFPSDLYRAADGRIELGAIPIPETRRASWEPIRRGLQQRSGFCVGCGVFFRVDGDLDPATVPHDAALDATATANDPIVLVDIDPSSPEHGRMIPLRVQWRLRDGLLAVRPIRGIVLRPRTRYAVAVTSQIHGADGTPLGAMPVFAALRDDAASTDPAVVRSRNAIGNSLDAIVAAGVPRGSIVGLAAFTTDDVTQDMTTLSRLLTAGTVPQGVAAVDRSWTTGTALDELFGTPAMPGFGVDIPAADGMGFGIAHEHLAAVIAGSFRAPRVISGTGADVGLVLRDASGAVRLGDTPNDVTFVLAIPASVDVAHLPVMVFLHGGEDYRAWGLALADALAARGVATLSIDLPFHGARSAHPMDTVNLRRSSAAPADGLAETSRQDAIDTIAALHPTDTTLTGSFAFIEGLFMQIDADAISTVRFARSGDLTAIRALDPSLATLAFDPDRVSLAGLSLGAFSQSVLVANSGASSAAMLIHNGSIVDEIAESAVLRPLYESVVFTNWGVPHGIDEVSSRLVFDPRWDLMRWSLDRLEPISVARNLYREPVTKGAQPDLLMLWGALDEEATPPGSDALAAAVGSPGVGMFPFANVTPAGALPITSNVSANGTMVTSVALRFENATHSLTFFRHAMSNYVPPLVPPFMQRATPLAIDNPVDAVQTQIAGFLGSRTASQRSSLSAP